MLFRGRVSGKLLQPEGSVVVLYRNCLSGQRYFNAPSVRPAFRLHGEQHNNWGDRVTAYNKAIKAFVEMRRDDLYETGCFNMFSCYHAHVVCRMQLNRRKLQ
ncbi:hypothetical protein D3C71_1614690 [compost metagenome]